MQVAGVVPPFGPIGRMRTMVPWKGVPVSGRRRLERDRRGTCANYQRDRDTQPGPNYSDPPRIDHTLPRLLVHGQVFRVTGAPIRSGYTTRRVHEPIGSLRAVFRISFQICSQAPALTIFTSVSYRGPCKLIMSGGRLVEARPKPLNRFLFPIGFLCFRYRMWSFSRKPISHSTFLNLGIARWWPMSRWAANVSPWRS